MVCKSNKPCLENVDITLREAAILAMLDGRGGAPRLISVLPSLNVIIMEYCGYYDLWSVVARCRKLQDIFYIRLLEDLCIKLREMH